MRAHALLLLLRPLTHSVSAVSVGARARASLCSAEAESRCTPFRLREARGSRSRGSSAWSARDDRRQRRDEPITGQAGGQPASSLPSS
jgi:hypothetical protein